ncbi:MAG TPA: serine hydrolase [Tepidisphaeraceae bacterium]
MIVCAISTVAFGEDISIAPPPPATGSEYSFGFAEPASQGVDVSTLIDLTRWIQRSNEPIFSVLISRNGKIFYELYTSGLKRNDAHYVMSVTKSVLSALVGAAIDRHYLNRPDESIADALPAFLFPNLATAQRFRFITLRDVLGMSALDAAVYPHENSPAARKRLADFVRSPNRTRFALQQNLLPRPGVDYQYTDVTCALAAGAVEYNTKMTLLDFANQALFAPMKFANHEWMHEDRTGIDNGAYGLRLRPVDMQKFGILYLNGGRWEGKQLLSQNWVNTSFTPWIRSEFATNGPDYGWYWWHDTFASGWVGHFADGWEGQRIVVFPAQRVVFTMTGAIDDGSELKIFTTLINQFVIPAMQRGGGRASPQAIAAQEQQLQALIEAVRTGPTRIKPKLEARLIPSTNHKEKHHPLRLPANPSPGLSPQP